MSKELYLTEDQTKHINQTLKRIRDGLAQAKIAPVQEPAHFYLPEMFNAI